MFNFKSLLNRPALLKIAGGYGPYYVANETFSSSMIVRWNCNVASKHVGNELHLENLPNRGLMKISGPDAAKLLQGIITNDIKSLSSESSSMFTLFLNTKGRVMCDAMIYKPNEVDTFLIDCDVSSLAILEKHMKLYRVRSNVNITPVDELTVCVLYDPASIESVLGHIDDVTESGPSNFHVKNNNYKRIQQILRDNHQLYRDPRLAVLGMRIISSRHIDVGKEINDKDVTIIKTALYLNYRYKLGIAEGSEIPNGVCFPFEINADFLNGVSFNKGCYIGQELTARTYHMGVVRKRIMPVYSSTYEFNDVEAGTLVKNSKDETKLPFGKFLAADGVVGIAILKVKEALTHQSLKIGNYSVKAIRPAWWPKEEDNLK